MATTARSRRSRFDEAELDYTQIEYDQVLAEARRHAQALTSLDWEGSNSHQSPSDLSISPANFKADALKKSLGDLKKKKSWKNTLFFFWKKSHRKKKVESVPPMSPQYPRFKSQSTPVSGPIYTQNDLYHTPCAPARLKSYSLPLSPPGTPKRSANQREAARTPVGTRNHPGMPSKSSRSMLLR